MSIVDSRRNHLYVISALYAARNRQPTDDERESRENVFVKKILRLVDVLDTEESRYFAFHAYVRVAATVFHPSVGRVKDVSDHAVEDANLTLYQMIRDRFEGQTGSESEDSKSATWPSSMYWDFAAARRKLWSTWQRGCNTSDRNCWHSQIYPLMEYIQRRAYSEIRAKVMLTVGAAMPTELTETIFRLAMEAEEAPLDGSMYQTEVLEIEEKDGHLHGEAGREVRRLRGWQSCATTRLAERCASARRKLKLMQTSG